MGRACEAGGCAPTRRRASGVPIGAVARAVLVVAACSREPAPSPVPSVPVLPAPGPETPRERTAEQAVAQIEALAVADATLHGPVRVESLTELAAPHDRAPQRIGRPAPQAERDAALVDAFAIADDGDVFVLDDLAGELVRQPHGDATGATVLARVPRTGMRDEQLFDVAVRGGAVVFVSTLRSFDGSEAAYAIREVSRDGGDARLLHRADVRGGFAHDVQLHDGAVLWHRSTEGDGPAPGAVSTGGTIEILPRTGGGPRALLRGVGGFYAWTLAGADVVAFVARQPGGGSLVRLPVQGGDAVTLLETQDDVGAIVAAPGGLAYTVRTDDPDRSALWRLPWDARAPERIGTFSGFPTSLAVDGDTVYTCDLPPWDEREPPTQTVRATPWQGGATRDVRAGVPRGATWTVVRGRLYWSGAAGVESVAVP